MKSPRAVWAAAAIAGWIVAASTALSSGSAHADVVNWEAIAAVGQRIMATQGPRAWPRCASCSQDEALMGSLTHLLTTMWAQTGGCRGLSRAVEEGAA
jgi:hypothetical protein